MALWWRDWNSVHQFGSSSLLARYAQTQSLGLSNGSGVARCLGLALCWDLLVSQDWSLLESDAVAEGQAWSVRLLGWFYRFRSYQVFTGNVVAPWASWGSSSSPRSTVSSSSVGDVSGPSSMGPSSEASTISSPSRCIKDTIHLWRSHAVLHRTHRGTINLSAQHCKAQLHAKVSSFLVTWKSFALGDQCRVGSPNDTVCKSCEELPTILMPLPG